MVEQNPTSAQLGSAVLDIGEDIGALIIYTRPELCGVEIEVSPRGASYRVHAAVLERRAGVGTVFAALFLALPADRYTVWCDAPTANAVTVVGSQVAELDWQGMVVAVPPKGEMNVAPQAAVPLDWLPARYRQGQPVCAMPMGSAPLRYDQEGQVAWNLVWTDFCDLALAGGPPHRGAMLEPVDPAEVLATPDAYALVVAEIEHGFRLVTEGLPTVPGIAPGWVGLRCPDEATAAWLTRAIEAENVAVRRDGAVLSLPAGPRFRQDAEIKNVVTVVAKTYHYWREHREG